MALVFCIGALPFVFSAHAYAGNAEGLTDERLTSEGEGREASGERIEAKRESKWLDDYSKPVGLTYEVEAVLNSTYFWRGLCIGGLNIQPSASVGYGGLYFTMWWNVGTANWAFTEFQPEVDLILGFNRWGVNASVMFVHNFNRRFFDFGNHPDGGNALEARFRYTVSSKLPLSFFWATRIGATDGYLNAAGDTIRPYSTYIELSYTQKLPYGLSLYGAFGITPWRSFYTNYEREFAVQNIEIRLRKDWDIHPRLGLMLQGMFSINPSALAADKSTAEWHPTNPTNQSINANVSVGIYLK